MDKTTASNLDVREPFRLKLDFTNNIVTIQFDPKLMLHCHDNNELDVDGYASALEHIKRRIDWCVRKSAGEEPNLDDYEA